MRLKEKNLLQKFAATLKKFSAQGAKKVEYGIFLALLNQTIISRMFFTDEHFCLPLTYVSCALESEEPR